jgi:hypothetical protein
MALTTKQIATIDALCKELADSGYDAQQAKSWKGTPSERETNRVNVFNNLDVIATLSVGRGNDDGYACVDSCETVKMREDLQSICDMVNNAAYTSHCIAYSLSSDMLPPYHGGRRQRITKRSKGVRVGRWVLRFR